MGVMFGGLRSSWEIHGGPEGVLGLTTVLWGRPGITPILLMYMGGDVTLLYS